MWWRILIPTWRFFDRVGPLPELLVLKEGEWVTFWPQPPVRWFSVLFNPQGNAYHAYQNLLGRLAQEISEGLALDQLVSLAIVRQLVGPHEFRFLVDGEEIHQGRGE